MNEPEIFARLIALHSALTAKLGAQPYISPTLDFTTSGYARIMLYSADRGCVVLKMCKHDTAHGVMSEAESFVAAMPDRDAAQKANWHRKLGDVIDEGHALALPDAVMAPLRAGSQAMTENLLGVTP